MLLAVLDQRLGIICVFKLCLYFMKVVVVVVIISHKILYLELL